MSQHTHEHTDSGASAQPSESETSISISPSESGGQLTLTQQSPLSAVTTVTLDAPVGDIWERITTTDGFQSALEAAVVGLVGDQPAGARAYALEQLGVTALDGLYASAVSALADENPIHSRWQEQALQLTQDFGSAKRSVVGLHAPVGEIVDGPLAVLRVSTAMPTVAVRVDDAFDELRADQRADIVELLADLANTVDLRIVATGRWQRKLAREYREQLPAVSEQCSAGPSAGAIAATVEKARAALGLDGRKVRILHQLAEQTSETLSYNQLYALHEVSDGAIRQCLTNGDQSLAELGLVETFSRAAGRGSAVELLAAGREFLDRLDAEIGRQQRLESVVSETRNPSDDSRVTPPAHEGRHSPDAEAEAVAGRSGCGSGSGAGVADDRDFDRHRLPHHHQVRSAARHRYAATAGTATDGGITLVDHPISEKDDRGEPHWYYNHEDDRLLVGAEYDNPMKGWVCIALALADPRTFRHVLTPERFEAGKLGDMLADHTDLLRNSRCLGYLADRNATAEDYTDALLEAADDLREFTKDWYHGNFEDSGRFRATILREAHGLAGTMIHLLDLADVDLVREFRLPNFVRDSDESDRHNLAETIAIGASIQSRYRESAAYRQLFESREDKRESVIPPRVDADDPFGEYIGSFVLVGKSVSSLADSLRRQLANQEVHDDAPEFGVRVPVEIADERRHIAQTVKCMCDQKSIRPTRAATSMLGAFTGTPYDVARALHNLGSETKAPGRRIRLDEVRYALSTLDTDRILPAMEKPALSKLGHALLVAETPLVQSELAEWAGVSARSIRTHTERLAAFDFIRETDAGWRFVLPLRGDGEHDEQGDDILPWFVATSDVDDEQEQDSFVRDVLAEVVHDLLPPDRYADPDDPIAGALFAEPGERVSALCEAWEWLDPWLSVVQMLCDDTTTDCTHAGGGCEPNCSAAVATIGIEPDQASLAAAAGGGG
jgi:hypothetical protein